MIYSKIMSQKRKDKSLRRIIRHVESRAGSLILQWMTPRNTGKTLILVEGPDDKYVYKHLFNMSSSFIRECEGCDVVRGVCEYVRKYKPSILCLGILDSDFRRLSGRATSRPNIVYTDTHDMETMIMFAPHCFSLFCRITACIGLNHSIIVDDLRLLSFMRWYNMAAHLFYTDEGLDIENATPEQMRDYSFLITKFKQTNGSNKTWLERCFKRFMQKHSLSAMEQVVNGHDYLARFFHYAKRMYGNQFTSEEKLELLAEVSDNKWFQTTLLFDQISSWEHVNGVSVLLP